MTDALAVAGRKKAYQLVVTQATLVASVVMMVFLVWGVRPGYSALLGGLIAVLPHWVFARLAFAHAGARAARQVVNGFYKGEAAKIGLTILLFVVVLKWVPVVTGALFATYGVALLAQWLAPVLNQRN